MGVLAYLTINIDPVIGHLGPLTFRWYSLIMASAAAVGFWIYARQLRARGIEGEHVFALVLIGIPSAMVGARLLSVLDNLGYYSHHLFEIIKPPYVGLAIYGVLLGGLGSLVVYSLIKKLPLLKMLDSAALALPVAQLIGRCANIINGDTWGSRTSLPWGFVYTNPHAFLPVNLLGVPTQPTPAYEQLWLLLMIGILLWALPRLKTEGMAILLYLGLYSFGRFFISFYRVNNVLFLGLREAQLFALAVLILVVPAAYWLRRRARASSAISISKDDQ